MNNIVHCLILDLKDNEELIKEYESHHKKLSPEIETSIVDSGIKKMQIFRAGNRLVMLMYVDEQFSFKRKSEADLSNPQVQNWERLMWGYQQPIPFADTNEKWVLTNKIYELSC